MQASVVLPGTATPDQDDASPPQTWDLVQLPVGDVGSLAEQLAGHGADALVLEPADLRDRVVALLRGALAAAQTSAVPAGSA
jgi:predicted DNA-binding transcriptional regulator YafY